MNGRSNNFYSKKNLSKEKLNSLSNKSFSVSSFNLSNNIQDNSKIVLRIKPKTEEEYLENNKMFEIKDNNLIEFMDSKNNSKIFKFDYIFNEDSQQKQLFEICSKEICDSLFEGYNGTIFTYGQIGSGKTYTILGPDYTKSLLYNSNFVFPNQQSNNNNITNIFQNEYLLYMKKKEEESKGLIPRSIEYLLDKKEELCEINKDTNLNIEIYCSFYEIFNDQLYDLFNNSSWINCNSSFVKEKGIEGTLKENLKKVIINNKNEVFDLIKLGNMNKESISFLMNAQSRNHTIFSINIDISKIENNNIIKNKSILNLVDLAGIEKQTSLDNFGDKIKDTGKINKSLLGLGNVIQNFGENFIPYRDTKLTFLLKESLGINSKTCFIVTISSLKKNIQETLFTLKFAQNIKKMKNKISNRNMNSKRNQLIEEENNTIITNEELRKEKDIFNNCKDEIINLVNILQKLGENSQEIYKFKEKFIQNSLVKKYLNEEYEQYYNELLNKKKEIESLEKENGIIENKINNLSIESIIREQSYNNLIKKQKESEKNLYNIQQKLDAVYKIWESKNKTLNEKNDLLNEQKEEHEKIKNDKKLLINENNKIISSKDNQFENIKEKIIELKNNMKNSSTINVELEKQINDLKEKIQILNLNYNKSEKELLAVSDKLLDNNNQLIDADNILNNTLKLYKNKLLNNKGDIIKLNSIIKQSSTNEIESKNKIFIIKNKIIEYDLYLKILNKTREKLKASLDELQNNNRKYINELQEKKVSYNNLIEINKDLKNKIDSLNKKFELIGGNKRNNKENETKSKIIKLNEENNELSKELSHSENVLDNLYVKNNNIFQYHQNLDQKLNEYKKIFNISQKELTPIIEKNDLRKSHNLINNIRNIKNLNENEKLIIFSLSLEDAISLLKEKEELIKNMKNYNENIRLKTISSVRENNIKTTDISLLKDIEHRNSFNLGQTNNMK